MFENLIHIKIKGDDRLNINIHSNKYSLMTKGDVHNVSRMFRKN